MTIPTDPARGLPEWVEALPRYILHGRYGGVVIDERHPEGEWVKFHELLAACPPPSEARGQKFLAIAGLVNAYYSDGTRLTAAETLKAIADVLGEPMARESGLSPVPAETKREP